MQRVAIVAVMIAAALGLSCNPQTGGGERRPMVDAGADRCVGEGDSVTLIATAEGSGVLSYRWSLERKPDNPDNPVEPVEVEIFDETSPTTTTSELTVRGQYVFRVVVTDSRLSSRASWVTVEVGPPGAGGDFCVGVDGPDTLQVGEEGTYTATPDHEGDFAYLWETLNSNGITTNGVSFATPDEAETAASADEPGVYILRVTVTNQDTGEAATGRITVTVSERPPLSVSIDGPDTGVVDERFELTAIAENAVGDVTYDWRVVSGSAEFDNQDQATVGVTPAEEGELVLEVEAADADTEQTATATKTVSIGSPEPPTVTVSATTTDPLLRVGDEVTLSASVEEAFDDIQYSWEVLEGPGTITDPNARETTLTADAGNTIRVQVTATATGDSGSGTGTAEVVVVSYEAEAGAKPEVVIDVEDFGTIGLAMEVDAAPKTVANFLRYVDEGFYEGVVFHRVAADFVIQAGGLVPGEGELQIKEPTHPPVEGEAPNGLSNIEWTVAMALAGTDADSGTSQFFVNLVDNSSSLDTGPPPFTVFAEVIDGRDVVTAITEVDTTDNPFAPPGEVSLPVEDIVIRAISRRNP